MYGKYIKKSELHVNIHDSINVYSVFPILAEIITLMETPVYLLS